MTWTLAIVVVLQFLVNLLLAAIVASEAARLQQVVRNILVVLKAAADKIDRLEASIERGEA